MIGIYQLNFSSGDTYIGKSVCIERRISHHKVNKGLGSPRLQKAFQEYEFLGYTLIEECYEEILSDREAYYISTLKPTLNILPGGEGFSGLNHPRSKYTAEQIKQVVNLFANDLGKTHKQISEESGVAYSTVQDIIKGRSHQWATKHLNLIEIEDERKLVDQTTIYDTQNNKYIVSKGEFTKFEEKMGWPSGTINNLRNSATGKSRSKGLSLYPFDQEKYILRDPEGNTIECTMDGAKNILLAFDLNQYNIDRILKKGKESVGWKLSLIAT